MTKKRAKKMRRAVRKRHVTLLEVLIALVLTIFIITTLTFFYQQMASIGINIDRMQKDLFYMRYLENRLNDIIPKILPPSDSEFTFLSLENDVHSKNGSQTLIFAFNNGISLDTTFSNLVIARLYVNPQGELTLAYWPSRFEWDQPNPPIKKEVLQEGVEKMTFEFFIAPEPKNAPKNAQGTNQDNTTPPLEPKGDWTSRAWINEYKELPLLLRITLKLAKNKGEEIVFAFPLPSAANIKAHIIIDL